MDKRWKLRETSIRNLAAMLWIALSLALLAACGAGSAGSGADGVDGQAQGAAAQRSEAAAGTDPGAASGTEPDAVVKTETRPDQGADGAGGKRTVYPLTVTDATGAQVTLEAAPRRIVSTSPSETEILFALGLGDRIVAVSDYDNYPPEALDKPKIGGTWDPNEEAIIAMEPDLVVGGISMSPDIAERLRSLGLAVYKAHPASLEEALDTIVQFGVLTDAQEEAERLAAAMREDIRRVAEAAAGIPEDEKVKVYFEIAPGWTVGRGEYLDELIRLAGGINVAGDAEGWLMVNEEHIIAQNPDVILYVANLVDFETGKTLEELIKSRPGWEKMKAIRENRFAGLDEDIISRTGPRITDALLQIAEALYPGLVKP